MAPALSVINFSIEQSTVPQITHKRSENLAASGNCLGCIINIAWYLQEKRGILQEMLHTKDFVCRKSLKDFNGYCSPGQPSTKTFHLFDMSRFQRRLERNQSLPNIYVSNIFEPQLLIVFRFACGWRLLLQSKKRWVGRGG